MVELDNIAGVLDRQVYLGNSLPRWIILVVVSLVTFVALRFIRRLLVHHANRLAEAGAGDWIRGVDHVVGQSKTWFLLILSLLCGSMFLVFPCDSREWKAMVMVAQVATLIQAALWADAFLLFSIAHYTERHKEADAASVTTLSALGFVGRLAIWTAAVLLAVANMGFDVSTMIAGLGIGGVAVALAAQNILSDLFASASIVLDKPFVLGDFIVVGDEMGTVEYIGLKTTRLRSLSGEQLVFSNADLLKSRIHNYKRMAERRVQFTIGIHYDTSYEKLAAIPTMLREAVESQKDSVRFDRAHFAKYGDSSLVFEVAYYVLSASYNVYMDMQQAINLEIYRRFAKDDISFSGLARKAAPAKTPSE
jgi:small-conductance mechanosensitive channel